MKYVNKIYPYQFGDPVFYDNKQGPDSFLFDGTQLSFSKASSIKTRTNENPYSDITIDYYGNGQAFLNSPNLSVSFSVPSNYDLNYLRKIFVRKKKKMFFVQYGPIERKIYMTYARYVSGLEQSFENGNDPYEANDGDILTFTLTFSIEDPRLYDITHLANILVPEALANESLWMQNISGSNWSTDPTPNFNWEERAAGYTIPVSSVIKDKTFFDYFPQALVNPTYYLSSRNIWFNILDTVRFDTNKSVSFTLTSNALTQQTLTGLDMSGYDNQTVWQIRLVTATRLQPNESVTLRNPDINAGMVFTWTGPGTSPNNILINTAQSFVYDLEKSRVINRESYTLSNAVASDTRLFVLQSSAMASTYPNPNIITAPPVIVATKQSVTNVTVHLNNLNIAF